MAGTGPGFGGGAGVLALSPFIPWHFLYFFPLPQGHGSFLPTFIRGITFVVITLVLYSSFLWGWLKIPSLSSIYHGHAR